MQSPMHRSASQSRESQLIVKRRTAQLPPELQVGSPASERVDWHASVMLNLVMQTSYQLTLAACRPVPGCPASLLALNNIALRPSSYASALMTRPAGCHVPLCLLQARACFHAGSQHD